MALAGKTHPKGNEGGNSQATARRCSSLLQNCLLGFSGYKDEILSPGSEDFASVHAGDDQWSENGSVAVEGQQVLLLAGTKVVEEPLQVDALSTQDLQTMRSHHGIQFSVRHLTDMFGVEYVGSAVDRVHQAVFIGCAQNDHAFWLEDP